MERVLSEQAYSYNELMFISAKIIAFKVKAEKETTNLQHNTLLLNNTLQNNQQPLLTN